MHSFEESLTARNPRMSGIDYLTFWCFGKFKSVRGSLVNPKDPRSDYIPGFFDLLEERQRIAAAGDGKTRISFDGIEFTIRAGGGGPPGTYRRHFMLEALGCHIGICPEKFHGDENKPQVYVEIKGETLTRFGHKESFQIVKRIFQAMGFTYDRSQVKRADLRVDFTEFTPDEIYHLCSRQLFVTRFEHKFFPVMGPGFKCETFAMGRRTDAGGICMRIYDKIAQADDDPDKLNLISDYILCGEKAEQLTRVEFELNRKALRNKFKISSVEDVLGSVATIAEYLTSRYFRIQRSVDRTNTTRSALHPIWQRVVDGFRSFASRFDSALPKVKPSKRQTEHEAKSVVVGYIAKIAAIKKASFCSAKDIVSFILEQFELAGETVAGFNQRVREKRIEIDEQSLDDCIKFFASASVIQKPLFDGGVAP